MAKKESATKKESASPVQVGVAPGTETGEDVVGGSEAEGGGSSERCPYVVGIGASAGGLQPLQEFFDNMPQDSAMAFVIVQHRDRLLAGRGGRGRGLPVWSRLE